MDDNWRVDGYGAKRDHQLDEEFKHDPSLYRSDDPRPGREAKKVAADIAFDYWVVQRWNFYHRDRQVPLPVEPLRYQGDRRTAS